MPTAAAARAGRERYEYLEESFDQHVAIHAEDTADDDRRDENIKEVVDLVKSAIALSIAAGIRWGKISADGMNVAKIAAAPMLRSSGRRPDTEHEDRNHRRRVGFNFFRANKHKDDKKSARHRRVRGLFRYGSQPAPTSARARNDAVFLCSDMCIRKRIFWRCLRCGGGWLGYHPSAPAQASSRKGVAVVQSCKVPHYRDDAVEELRIHGTRHEGA